MAGQFIGLPKEAGIGEICIYYDSKRRLAMTGERATHGVVLKNPVLMIVPRAQSLPVWKAPGITD